jgi:hypothetical protein
LEEFGLNEHHALAVGGGTPRKILLHKGWLGLRKVIEQERENEGTLL